MICNLFSSQYCSFFPLSFSIFISYFFGVTLIPRRYFNSTLFSSHCDQDQQSKFIPITISKHNTQLFQIGLLIVKNKISNMFMYYVYIEFCLGIRVGNEVRRVAGMTLMPSMPKSIPAHLCTILKKKTDLDRGFIGSSIEGLSNPRSKVWLSPLLSSRQNLDRGI